MSCSSSFWAIGVAFAIVLILSGGTYLVFLRHCKELAIVEDREAEFLSEDTNDEIGANSYVREQYGKVFWGRQSDYPSAEIALTATRLRKSFWILTMVFVILIGIAAWVDTSFCP